MKSFQALAVAALVILSFANSIDIVRAGDPDPLQDICVADLKSEGNYFICNIICMSHIEYAISCSYML